MAEKSMKMKRKKSLKNSQREKRYYAQGTRLDVLLASCLQPCKPGDNGQHLESAERKKSIQNSVTTETSFSKTEGEIDIFRQIKSLEN